jgi:hypothetical protein
MLRSANLSSIFSQIQSRIPSTLNSESAISFSNSKNKSQDYRIQSNNFTTSNETKKQSTVDSQQTQLIDSNTNLIGFSVLQCKNCRTIVGDTFSTIYFNRESFLLTLSNKNSNLLVDDELDTAKDESESDYGCTFNNIFCKNCHEWIGRHYLTTTPLLDNLRLNYTISLNQILL